MPDELGTLKGETRVVNAVISGQLFDAGLCGAMFCPASKDGLPDKFATQAPRPHTAFDLQYKNLQLCAPFGQRPASMTGSG